MNEFDYQAVATKLMTPEIMRLVGAIHEYRGKQQLYIALRPDVLDLLTEVALVQSTGASNRIENIHTSSDVRLRALLQKAVEPKNRSEREIVGYRYVLDMIHTSYADIPVTPNVILQLHRDLYRSVDVSLGGRWKEADNVIAERAADGTMVARFKPTSAVATPGAIRSLCEQYKAMRERNEFDDLLLVPMFVFDFVNIHPFDDGNGRMSRLLTLLLLYKADYLVGRYISIEGEIERTKTSYYQALKESSIGWDSGDNDYGPFVRYLLGVILACYRDLDERVGLLVDSGDYEGRVRRVFSLTLGAISKRELMDMVPGMSRATAERILQALQANGEIEKIGAARATKYRAAQPRSAFEMDGTRRNS